MCPDEYVSVVTFVGGEYLDPMWMDVDCSGGRRVQVVRERWADVRGAMESSE